MGPTKVAAGIRDVARAVGVDAAYLLGFALARTMMRREP